MVGLFNTFIYEPIYNALVVLVSVVPGGDVGVAIILLTVLIRFVLFPLSAKAIKTQIAMREIDPELKRLREVHKEEKEVLARKTMELFKEKKVNPFASIFLILIQLPIIFGLYFVFLGEGRGASFDPALLYSFVSVPEQVSFFFLGLVDLTGKSIILALIVAVTQFVNARIMMPKRERKEGVQSFQDDLAQSMQTQMRWVFPVVIGVVAYFISAAVALYFIASNVFSLAQELYVKRNVKNATTE